MANKKGTGRGRKPAKTTAKKPAETQEPANDNKVVKFEKKAPAVDFDGKITYIKIPVKKEIPIIMYKKSNDRGTKEITFKSTGRATDNFIAALQNLAPYFLNVVEIPNKADETIITGVSFSETGVVIIGQIELTENDIKSPLNVNTPHVVFESESGGYTVPEYAKNLIDELKRQAVLYMNGEAKEVQTEIPGIKEG